MKTSFLLLSTSIVNIGILAHAHKYIILVLLLYYYYGNEPDSPPAINSKQLSIQCSEDLSNMVDSYRVESS